MQPHQNESRQQNIIFLGESGFPYGLASIQRLILMAKAYLSAGSNATVLCRKGSYTKDREDFGHTGTFEGISYHYTVGTIYRPDGFLKRNLQKIKGMYGEYIFLRDAKKRGELDAVVVSSMSFLHIFLYRCYTYVLGIPMILNFVELASSMKHREQFLTRLNDLAIDNWLIKKMDAALPISEMLMNYFEEKAHNKPKMKVPILCDFEKFAAEKNVKAMSVKFLYCGDASYYELIDFIISCYDRIEDSEKPSKLELVLGGDCDSLEKVRNRIETSSKSTDIILSTNVDHKDIPKYYANANALLIPLRPTKQDEARFPHKIGEYLGSARPIITTNIGEIQHYPFINEETALIAEKYELESYSERMQYVLDNINDAIEIGEKGRKMGEQNFSYQVHGEALSNFTDEVANQN